MLDFFLIIHLLNICLQNTIESIKHKACLNNFILLIIFYYNKVISVINNQHNHEFCSKIKPLLNQVMQLCITIVLFSIFNNLYLIKNIVKNTIIMMFIIYY